MLSIMTGCRASAPYSTSTHPILVMHECNNASGLLLSALVFRSFARLICCQPAESAGLVRGYMDDLIGRIGATTGVDRAAAEKAVGFNSAIGEIVGTMLGLGQFVRRLMAAAGQEPGELDVLLDQRHRRIDADEARALRSLAFATTERLLEAAKNPKGRRISPPRAASMRSGSCWANLADKLRIKGMGRGIRRAVVRGRHRHRQRAQISQPQKARQGHGRGQRKGESSFAFFPPRSS